MAHDLTRDDFNHILVVPTRWADADYFGHVNNVKFARYLECGRIEYFVRLLNLEFSPRTENGLIIANLNLAFREQINHPQNLEIGTRVSKLGNSSLTLESAIYVEDRAEPVGTAEEILVWFNYIENRSERIPDFAREAILNFEGDQLA